MTLNAYPEYKGEPMKYTTRKKEDPEKEEKIRWKPNGRGTLSMPSKSMITLLRNVRVEFPHVFRPNRGL
jgi:hypothetical protein